MKLHYMGKFNLDPNTLPQAEHKPGATEFKEADSMKKLAVIANAVSFVIFAVLAVAAYLRLPDITRGKSSVIAWGAAPARLSAHPVSARAAPRRLLQK